MKQTRKPSRRPERRTTPKRGRTGRRVPPIPRPTVPVLRFLGAAGTVTGSRFLVDTSRARVLIDCGLFQGEKALRLRNWSEFPVPPGSIDAVVLTHAHLDHCGWLPALVRNGFRGDIFCTPGTLALAGIVLPDAGHIQEEDAAYANRKGFSKHMPALPLFTEEDAAQAVSQLRAIPFHTRVEIGDGVRVRFTRAGHILGAATVALELEGKAPRRLVVSGDLGRGNHPVLLPPEAPPEADVLLIESTYGDRLHPDGAALDRFVEAIVRTAGRGGTIVIPAFAVDRTEVILFTLRELMQARRVPELPVYVDSPMALGALSVYRNAIGARSDEIRPEMAQLKDPFDPGRLFEVRDAGASRALNDQKFPSILVSASGMATGGRVLHHLATRLPDPRNCVVLPGFQAAGTRGRSLLEGATMLKLLGRYVPVRANVVHVDAFSVHADRSELLDWLRKTPRPPETTYVVHGEPEASEALRAAISQDLRWGVATARNGECVRLD